VDDAASDPRNACWWICALADGWSPDRLADVARTAGPGTVTWYLDDEITVCRPPRAITRRVFGRLAKGSELHLVLAPDQEFLGVPTAEPPGVAPVVPRQLSLFGG
jgi:hypothetical protein